MKSFSNNITTAPVISGVEMFVWQTDSVSRLHLWNRREPADGQDEIAKG